MFLQPELIRQAGYPAETHYVTTQDGYILAMHRIPHGITNGEEDITRPVIFVQHGLLCSSADWVMPTPSKGLGRYLIMPPNMIFFLLQATFLLMLGMTYGWETIVATLTAGTTHFLIQIIRTVSVRVVLCV